uniref:D-2-hydroxyacid dehydrogenase n=1 Tax=Eiseniibacteriota bacterium TaxID=2212470 RepID=A0A832I6Y4_UNCEI
MAGGATGASGDAAARVRRPPAVWHPVATVTLRVLEWVRSDDAVWNLPASALARLAAAFPGVRFDAPRDEAEAERLLPEADVVYGWAVRRDNFSRCARLRWIHVSAAGVGPLLFPELVESPVVVTNGRGLHAVSMAEHALGVLLALARKLHLARDAQARRAWAQRALWTEPPPFAQLEGATLGVFGFGAVGRAIATRARALGMRVLAVRRRPAADPGPAEAQWGPERLGDLCAASDAIVLCAPLTAETRGALDAAALARLRPHAVLVNLGRGALVDEEALVAALREGRLAGAALDVMREEPLPADSPLWALPNVLLTPHVSGLGPRYWERAVDQFGEHLAAFLEGRPLPNLVDKRAGY